MLQNRSSTRQFLSAPPSASSYVAAFLEPVISIAGFIGISLQRGDPIDRAGTVLCLLVFALSFPGINRFRDRPLYAAVDVLTTWATLLTILFLCAFATDSFGLFDRRTLLAWAIVTPVVHWLVAFTGRHYLRWRAAQPAYRRTAVVIGGGPLGLKLGEVLKGQRERGTHFLGYFDDRGVSRLDAAAAAVPRLGTLTDVGPYLSEYNVNEVYISLPLSSQPRISRLLASLQNSTASVYLAPDVFGISIIQGRLQDLGGVPVVGMLETPFTGANELAKRYSDLVLASLILVLISPLMLAVAVGVKLSSPGPVIFRQRRNGLNGEEITVYKFRSMTATDNGAVVHQAQRNDPRTTRFGAFLRRSSLDELPQFINVLQGRMSIVGPRPHAVAHNEQYRSLIQTYMLRHKVRPGITGWAQVNGLRGETETVDKMQARVEYDLEYLRNWSLGFDLRIIARTLKLVLFDRGAY
jgi:putative colanic acid biosysnthesis UDP-glucose lipid carrier transferase